MPETNNDRVVIFDTTLRDAEQTPGAKLSVQEKLEIAHQLTRLKVDVIEAGFPISSNEDFEAVRRISHEVEGPVICALARAIPKDINRAVEALQDCSRARIHTFVGTSPYHMEMMRKSPVDVLYMASHAVSHARALRADVEFSAMDASRSDPNFLRDVIAAAIEAGATTINIPDTVGYSVPEQFIELVSGIVDAHGQRVIVSVHCHDDIGMATANTLSALWAGARQAECTINGLGERAGNAALEEVVMALRTRHDYFGLTTNVDAKQIYPTSQLVSRLMRATIAPNKAIVGANAFAHSSGIHQDGVLKNRQNFEIMDPRDVGRDGSTLPLTARSGRHALRHRLEQLGYHLSPAELEAAYERFLDIADKKAEVFDEDLAYVVSGFEGLGPAEKYKLDYLHTTSGTGTIPTATVRIGIDGEKIVQEAACGDGPVDATYNAIRKAVAGEVQLEGYASRSVTRGQDAIGEVTVKLARDGQTAIGRGASTDIIEAGARAFIDGLNRLARQAAVKEEAAAAK